MDEKKIAKKIEVAKKYKLDRPLSENMKKDVEDFLGKPYMTVTYMQGGKTDIVEFPLKTDYYRSRWF